MQMGRRAQSGVIAMAVTVLVGTYGQMAAADVNIYSYRQEHLIRPVAHGIHVGNRYRGQIAHGQGRCPAGTAEKARATTVPLIFS